MSNIPKEMVKLIEKIHRDFIWDKKRPNIKHSTLIGDDSKGGLKDIDILSKFKSLHFWLKRLFDENYHPLKLIPLHYINIASSNTLLFLPNLDITANRINDVPDFYQNTGLSKKKETRENIKNFLCVQLPCTKVRVQLRVLKNNNTR